MQGLLRKPLYGFCYEPLHAFPRKPTSRFQMRPTRGFALYPLLLWLGRFFTFSYSINQSKGLVSYVQR